MKALEWICLFVVVLSLAALPVRAQQEQDVSKQGPCRADIQKFCKNVKPGKGRVMRCMKQYEKYLSDACSEHIGEVKERTATFKKVCQRDVQKFCTAVTPGQGRIQQCLKDHQAELSPRCSDYVR